MDSKNRWNRYNRLESPETSGFLKARVNNLVLKCSWAGKWNSWGSRPEPHVGCPEVGGTGLQRVSCQPHRWDESGCVWIGLVSDGPRKVFHLLDLYGFVLDKVIHGLLNNAGTFAGDYTGQRKETLEGNEYSFLGSQASALSVHQLWGLQDVPTCQYLPCISTETYWNCDLLPSDSKVGCKCNGALSANIAPPEECPCFRCRLDVPMCSFGRFWKCGRQGRNMKQESEWKWKNTGHVLLRVFGGKHNGLNFEFVKVQHTCCNILFVLFLCGRRPCAHHLLYLSWLKRCSKRLAVPKTVVRPPSLRAQQAMRPLDQF